MTKAVGADLCVCPETSTSAFRADTQVRPYSGIIEPFHIFAEADEGEGVRGMRRELHGRGHLRGVLPLPADGRGPDGGEIPQTGVFRKKLF